MRAIELVKLTEWDNPIRHSQQPASAQLQKASPKDKKYMIIIGEIVTGKSKGPKGFERFKPIKYSDGSQEHTIVYHYVWDADVSEDEAWKYFSEVMSVMRGVALSLRKTNTGEICTYDMVLFNITDDVVTSANKKIPCTGSGGNFVMITGALLRAWRLI